MPKQKSSLRHIFKINSARLVKADWNLTITPQDGKKNGEIIKMADSQLIRFIHNIRGYNCSEDAIAKIKKKIKVFGKSKTNAKNKLELEKAYLELNDILLVKDYICVVFENNIEFDRANEKFTFNQMIFKRLLATAGGAKNNTVIYVNEEIHEQLTVKIENGRKLGIELLAGKLEAYKSLVCTQSDILSKPKGVIVINDCKNKFKADVIKIQEIKKVKYPDVTPLKDWEVEINNSDGYGLVSYYQAEIWSKEMGLDYVPSVFVIRNAFLKGCLIVVDFHDFSVTVAEKSIVIDAWNHPRDIIEKETHVVLTTSMLKLYSSYDSYEDYERNYEANGYTYSVNKVTKKKLENERHTNYQFIQPLELNDIDIDRLIEPTITEIKEVRGGDYRKSILFLNGTDIKEEYEEGFNRKQSDFIKALMIEKDMIHDPFVKSKIKDLLAKRIDDAKAGVLKINNSNLTIITGDPYALMEKMFDLPVQGLLKKGEFFNKYWSDKNVKKVAAFRSPMTCHNNIRLLNIVSNAEMKKWYGHLETITIFNCWDTTSDAMNSADYDSDTVFTTNFPVILENVKELDTIYCVQNTVNKKEVITEEDLIEANKKSFGDLIGITTNKISSMLCLQSQFEKGSKEYEELEYRIMCGQNYQQNAIDKTKGIEAKTMPREWYSRKANTIHLEDWISTRKSKDGTIKETLHKKDTQEEIERKEFNLRILVDKSPYFFMYTNPAEKKEYDLFKKLSNINCIGKFGINLDELKRKNVNKLSKNEKVFLDNYNLKVPLIENDSVMNRICKKIEDEFKKSTRKKTVQFDHTILMSDSGYSESTYRDVKELYEKYIFETTQYLQKIQKTKVEKEDKKSQTTTFKENFKQVARIKCNNEEELANIVVELCYKNNKTTSSKQFAWDVSGTQIIKNLLIRNDNIINYPVMADFGDIEFDGERFSMITQKLKGEI